MAVERGGDWVFTDSPWAGGAEVYLHSILRGAGPDRLGIVGVERPGLASWLSAREQEGHVVHRIAPGSRSQEWARALRCLRGLAPRLVHVNLPGPYDGLFGLAPWIARRAGARRVLVTEHLPTVGRVGRRWWLKRAALGAIDTAICVCRHHEPAMAHLGYPSATIRPVVNGIPDPWPGGPPSRRTLLPASIAAELGPGGPIVAQVGTLEARKGADLLLQALALDPGGLRLRAVLVGDGPERSALERQRADLGLGGRVAFAGWCEDVPGILAACDLAVLPSHREGLPLSLIEAAACGLPIVASDVDGIPEVVLHGRTGLLVPAGDPLALATALSELARDPRRRRSFGQRSREHYERYFREGRMVQETLALHGGSG